MIKIRVFGLPQPGGSKRAFMRKGMKCPIVTDANPKAKGWKAMVADAAVEAVRGNPEYPLVVPLEVHFNFFMPRNKGHFGTGKNEKILKPNAPRFHAVKPDCTKLIRSTEDALTNIVWRDDAQIVWQEGVKRYANAEQPIGVEIIIIEADDKER